MTVPESDPKAGEIPEWLTLDENERIEWTGRPVLASVVSALIWGVVLLPVFGIGLLLIVGSFLSLRNTDYVVTNTTLYVKRGILSTSIESVGLDKIQNTEYSQSFLGGQFDYATIQISTAGSEGAEIAFRAIENAREVRELINRLSSEFDPTAGRPVPETAVAGPDEDPMVELLEELTATRKALENVERALRARSGDEREPDVDPRGSSVDERDSGRGDGRDSDRGDGHEFTADDSGSGVAVDGSEPGRSASDESEPGEGSVRSNASGDPGDRSRRDDRDASGSR